MNNSCNSCHCSVSITGSFNCLNNSDNKSFHLLNQWPFLLQYYNLADLSLLLVASFVMNHFFSRNCGLAAKIVGRPVAILDNPLAPQPARSFVELRESVIPMLLALGPSVHYDPVLMYKVLRLAKAALTQVLCV